MGGTVGEGGGRSGSMVPPLEAWMLLKHPGDFGPNAACPRDEFQFCYE